MRFSSAVSLRDLWIDVGKNGYHHPPRPFLPNPVPNKELRKKTQDSVEIFAGVGSIFKACQALGMNSVGIDKNYEEAPMYVKSIVSIGPPIPTPPTRLVDITASIGR